MAFDRRHMLGALAATTTVGLATPAITQSRVLLTATTPWPATPSGPGALAPRLARRLNELSGGQISLEVAQSGQVGLEPYVAAANGDVAICFGREEDWIELNPAYGLFCGSPFGMTANEFEGWIYYGDGANVWDRLAAESGLKPLLVGDLGLIPTLVSTRDNELSSLSGLNALAPGLAGEFWRTMGVDTSRQPATIIDDPFLGGFSGLGGDLAVLAPSVSRPHQALSANVNLGVFGALSEEHKGLVELAMRAEHMAQRMDAENASRRLSSARTVQLSPLVATQMALATKELMAKIEGDGPVANDVVWSYHLHLEDARAWTEISEGAYLAKRLGSVS